MTATDWRTLTLRVDAATLARIDRAAAERGESRTQYVLSWLPVHWDKDQATTLDSADLPPNSGRQAQRVA